MTDGRDLWPVGTGRWNPELRRTEWCLRCASCGVAFLSARSHARTCSIRCRGRLRRGHRAPELDAGEGPLVLSLCDRTGTWPAPYRAAGYRVRSVDLSRGDDVRLLEHPKEPVHGVLAAPPCTLFSSAGAAHWKDRTDRELLDALAVVDACLRLVAMVRPRWWCLENPPGRLERWLGPPTASFQPWQYGDPWTKKTHLWGDFVMPPPSDVVDPEYGRLDSGSTALRSQTPGGFSIAFARSNP